MSFIPLADRLLVKADPVPEQYHGDGVTLDVVGNEDSRLPLGTVLKVGANVDPSLLGKRIMFEKYCGEYVPLYSASGNVIKDMLVLKLEDVKGYDDGTGDESLPD